MTEFYKPLVFRDEVQIGADVVKVEFTPEEISSAYFRLLDNLVAAEKNSEADPETFARLLVEFMALIFGTDGTKSIVAYYNGQEKALVEAVTRYAARTIAPVMRKASKERAKRIKRENRLAFWRRFL